MTPPRAVTSTADNPWHEISVQGGRGAQALSVTEGAISRDFLGFGGCFNELGWVALQGAASQDRDLALRRLFAPGEGCGFSYCRLPIGANDFATGWYSYCETPGDFELTTFSIERDEACILPFLRAAQDLRPEPLRLFASPWSPPTWLKHPPVYNFGHLIKDARHQTTYADYFVRYLQAYAAKGFPVEAVHVQNEPDSDQKFPSCRWSGAELGGFIADYLGPALERAGVPVEIWLGTVERGDFNAWVGAALSVPGAAVLVRGLGFQWAGKAAVQRSHMAYPDLPIIQTECECGDGRNDWSHALYVFDLIQHYLTNGARAFVYWNMALPADAVSTWGWKQNSLVSVDMTTGALRYNPEFWILRHFAEFVQPGATVLPGAGVLSANALCFRNPDGSRVAVIRNASRSAQTVDIGLGQAVRLELPADSVTSLRLS